MRIGKELKSYSVSLAMQVLPLGAHDGNARRLGRSHFNYLEDMDHVKSSNKKDMDRARENLPRYSSLIARLCLHEELVDISIFIAEICEVFIRAECAGRTSDVCDIVVAEIGEQMSRLSDLRLVTEAELRSGEVPEIHREPMSQRMQTLELRMHGLALRAKGRGNKPSFVQVNVNAGKVMESTGEGGCSRLGCPFRRFRWHSERVQSLLSESEDDENNEDWLYVE